MFNLPINHLYLFFLHNFCNRITSVEKPSLCDLREKMKKITWPFWLVSLQNNKVRQIQCIEESVCTHLHNAQVLQMKMKITNPALMWLISTRSYLPSMEDGFEEYVWIGKFPRGASKKGRWLCWLGWGGKWILRNDMLPIIYWDAHSNIPTRK